MTFFAIQITLGRLRTAIDKALTALPIDEEAAEAEALEAEKKKKTTKPPSKGDKSAKSEEPEANEGESVPAENDEYFDVREEAKRKIKESVEVEKEALKKRLQRIAHRFVNLLCGLRKIERALYASMEGQIGSR